MENVLYTNLFDDQKYRQHYIHIIRHINFIRNNFHTYFDRNFLT